MILTNERVAELLERRRIPTLYRVHEQPDPERIRWLVEQLAALDVPTPALPDSISPQQAGELAGEASRLVAREAERRGHGREAYTSLVLRSLKPAHYSDRNLGHAGLGSSRLRALHLADPPLPGPGGPPGAAVGDRRGRGGAAGRAARGAGRPLLGARAGRHPDRARRRLGLRLLPARAGALRARAPRRASRGRCPASSARARSSASAGRSPTSTRASSRPGGSAAASATSWTRPRRCCSARGGAARADRRPGHGQRRPGGGAARPRRPASRGQR